MLVSGVDGGKNALTTICFYLFCSRKLLSITFPSHPLPLPLSFRLARHLPPLPLSAHAYPIHLPISPLPLSSFACAPTHPSHCASPLPLRAAHCPSVLSRRPHCIAPFFVSPFATPRARTLHPFPRRPSLGSPPSRRRSPSLHPIANPHAPAPSSAPPYPFPVSPLRLSSTLMHVPCYSAAQPPCPRAVIRPSHPSPVPWQPHGFPSRSCLLRVAIVI